MIIKMPVITTQLKKNKVRAVSKLLKEQPRKDSKFIDEKMKETIENYYEYIEEMESVVKDQVRLDLLQIKVWMTIYCKNKNQELTAEKEKRERAMLKWIILYKLTNNCKFRMADSVLADINEKIDAQIKSITG